MAVIAFSASTFLLWQKEVNRVERIHLEMVPEEFEVEEILYANSGCGDTAFIDTGLPGADCSGVIIYKLPEKSARLIIKNGSKFFQELHRKFAIKDWGYFKAWQPTPVPLTDDWVSHSEESGPLYPHTLFQFIYSYALPSKIGREVEMDINHFISTPGGYFTRDRFGVMIVRPVEERIVYFYRN